MKRNSFFLFLTLLTLSSCIGTDFVDDPLGPVPSVLELSHTSAALLEGETLQLSAQVIASDESLLDGTVSWSSNDPAIATVDPTGLLTAVSAGQTWIGVYSQTLQDSVLVTVSNDPEALVAVTITNSPTELSIGDVLQLEVELRATNGTLLTDKVVTWESSNPEVCSISDEGLATALTNGVTQIIASSEGLSSLPFTLMVGSDALSRSGTFQGLNGYSVAGTAVLERSADQASVQLESDFQSQSGPGLYLYLSPNPNNVNGGINLGSLQATSGAQTYALPTNANPDDFDYVLVYCQPFGVPFGTAHLE